MLDNPNKMQPQNLTLLPGEETCEHIYFYVMVRFGFNVILVAFLLTNHFIIKTVLAELLRKYHYGY